MTESQFWEVCRKIRSLFQGRRDFEGVFGRMRLLAAVALCCCVLWTRGQRGMQITEETAKQVITGLVVGEIR